MTPANDARTRFGAVLMEAAFEVDFTTVRPGRTKVLHLALEVLPGGQCVIADRRLAVGRANDCRDDIRVGRLNDADVDGDVVSKLLPVQLQHIARLTAV